MQRGETGKKMCLFAFAKNVQLFTVRNQDSICQRMATCGIMKIMKYETSEVRANLRRQRTVKLCEICRHHPRSAASVLMESDSAHDGGTTWNNMLNNITKHQNVQSSLNILRTCLRDFACLFGRFGGWLL